MCSQLVDFNADGHNDLVMGTFEGIAWLVPGNQKGYDQPVSIKASDGSSILLSQFFNHEEKKWDFRDCSPIDQKKSNPKDHCISVVAFDWDNDKDLDLILGAKKGGLYLRRNDGTPQTPAFVSFNEPIKTGDRHLKIPGGLTAPRLIDWDGDGLMDLVCGSFAGGVFLCKNSGNESEPKFEKPEALIPNVKSGYKATSLTRPTSASYVDVVDYDEDGDLDLIVGGYSSWKPKQRKLNEQEKEILSQLEQTLQEITREYEVLRDNATREAKDKNEGKLTAAQSRKIENEIMKSDEYKALLERRQQCMEEAGKFVSQSKYKSYVWFYERK